LNKPEEIKNWVERRKMNYPSFSNIERKKRIDEERKECGEICDVPMSELEKQLRQ
jgi:hypothetical protein